MEDVPIVAFHLTQINISIIKYDRCTGQPFFSTKSMGDLHQMIIHNNSQMISRHTICFQQNFIINQ